MSDIPRKSIETFVVRVITQASAVGVSIMLARVLGAYSKGIFTYVGSVMAILQVAGSGQASAISWQYGKLRYPSGAVLNAMRRNLTKLTLPVAALVAIIAIVVPGQSALLAVAIAYPFAYVAASALGFYLADGNVRICNVQALITSVGFAVAVIAVLLIFHLGLVAVLVAWVLATASAAAYALIKLRPYAARDEAPAPALIREQLVFGSKIAANTVVGILNYRIDIFILLFILGAKSLGVYSVAIGFGELLWQLSRPLAFSAFGRVSSGSRKDAIELTVKCLRHTFVLVGTTCLILFFVGPVLIKLVYGPAFAGAGVVLRFLLPGILAYSLMPFLGTFFNQQLGKPVLLLLVLSISTVICAVITLATIWRFGIVSGAIGTSLSYVISMIVAMRWFKAETGVRVRSLFVFDASDLQPYKTLLSRFAQRVKRFVPTNGDQRVG
jgi:O-antigen/teichoic acid export membrane protein